MNSFTVVTQIAMQHKYMTEWVKKQTAEELYHFQ